jgi:plasmid stabilization system protein ParE
MRPRVLPDAEAEILSAALWYEDQRSGLGEEFYDQILATIETIGRNPERFPVYEASTDARERHRALVKRFPYVVIYEIAAGSVLIVAVAHTSRQPDYWRLR